MTGDAAVGGVTVGGVTTGGVTAEGGFRASGVAAGAADTATTALLVAADLGCAADDVAVCSTGLIGVRLPMKAVSAGVHLSVQQLAGDGGVEAAAAIMTTDTRPETTSVTRSGVTVAGMAKGAGMLAPGMATMLAVITTDASAAPATLDAALRRVTSRTFDRIDSDGCMSTNDAVIAMASGASGVIVGRDFEEEQFVELLDDVCRELARQLLADAEGASKEIEISVTGASSETDAYSS